MTQKQRFEITPEFRAATLANYLDHQGKVKVIPRKEKKKIVLLTYFSESIPKNQCFSEQEINQLIQVVFADFAAIRRYLIDYGFLARETDGQKYWQV